MKRKKTTMAAALVRGTAAGAVAAVARRLPGRSRDNDPIVMLEADHRRFESLLEQGSQTTERATKTRARILATLTAELKLHERLEERVLYPALAPHAETRDIVLEGFEEHHVADLVVKELRGVRTNSEQWGAKFKVLHESLEHHIKEEERIMFRAARAVLDREALDRLGARMKTLRRKRR